jgi:hypothetical protein
VGSIKNEVAEHIQKVSGIISIPYNLISFKELRMKTFPNWRAEVSEITLFAGNLFALLTFLLSENSVLIFPSDNQKYINVL